jgi:hypothetical protein
MGALVLAATKRTPQLSMLQILVFALPSPTVFGRSRHSERAKTGPLQRTEVIDEAKFRYNNGKIGSPKNKLPLPAPAMRPVLCWAQDFACGLPIRTPARQKRAHRGTPLKLTRAKRLKFNSPLPGTSDATKLIFATAGLVKTYPAQSTGIDVLCCRFVPL